MKKNKQILLNKNTPSNLPHNNHFSKNYIPNVIMQTWKNNQVPDKWSSSPKSIKDKLPNWKYVLLTDDDNLKFVKKHFPDFLPIYQSFRYPIQKADAIRYMWLYINGGVYMDLDFEINNDLEDYLEKNRYNSYPETSIFLVQYKMNGKPSVTNSFMISKPKHPFWLEVIEEMKKPLPWYYKTVRFTHVYYSTGPAMLTNVYNKTKYKDIDLINQKFACTKGLKFIEKDELKFSLIKSIELSSGESWHGNTEKILKFIMSNKILIISVFLILLAIFIFVATGNKNFLIRNKMVILIFVLLLLFGIAINHFKGLSNEYYLWIKKICKTIDNYHLYLRQNIFHKNWNEKHNLSFLINKDNYSNKTKFVIIAQYNEETEWCKNINMPYDIVSRKKYPRETAPNKGNEASVYLEYICKNYNNLPDICIFIHAHRSDWHHATNMDKKLNKLNFKYKYYNINEAEITTIPLNDNKNYILFNEIEPIIGKVDISKIKYRKSAQFYVTKELILQHPLEYYKKLLDWLWNNKETSFYTGRIMEYIWHYIFTGSYIDVL